MGSEHPLAQAVLRKAKQLGIVPSPVDQLVAVPGAGMRGELLGRTVSLSASRPRESGTEFGVPRSSPVAAPHDRAQAWSTVRRDGEILGRLGFLDEMSAEVPKAVRSLREDGIDVVLVTGDNESAARRVAFAAGISEMHAECTPQDKLRILQEYQQKGRQVAFVGDGINDAPSLTAADLGIAIGAGADVAREAGQVVLIRRDFQGVVLALRIGRRTMAKVRQNLVWALGYNSVLLPIAAGLLVPILGFEIYNYLPIAGAAAMALSSTSVMLNSFSLRGVSSGSPEKTPVREPLWLPPSPS